MKRKILKYAYLKANSPKKAFYILKIEKITDGFLISKESGGNGKIFHKESWFRENFEEAESLFKKIIRQKTNPQRKSPRKYKIIKFYTLSRS